MQFRTELKNLIISLLKQHKSPQAAGRALAQQLESDAELCLKFAVEACLSYAPKTERPKEMHSRRKVGPHRRPAGVSGLPTSAQKAGALKAERKYAETIFDLKMRGGKTLGEIHVHELRAIAEKSATTATSFLQRGYLDATETILCERLSKHCVSADPFALVKDVIKPAIASDIYTKAQIRAAEVLRDGGETLAKKLIAAAAEDQPPQLQQ